MNWAIYLKTRAFEAVLCALSATALSYTFCSGFFATQPIQSQPWIIGLSCFALVFLLYVVVATPRSLLVGGIALGAAFVALLVSFAVTGPGATPVDDVEGNYCIFLLIVAATSLAAFLLSRTRAGCVVWLVLGSIACAFVEFLYWYDHAVAFGLFVVAGIGLAIVRNYQKNLVDSESDRYAFGSVSIAGVVLAGISLGVACIVFTLVISPLNPPNMTMKLFTEYRRAEVVEVSGSESVEHVQGEEESNNTVEGDEDTSDAPEEEEVRSNNTLASMLGMDTDSSGDSAATTGLLHMNLLFLLVPLAIVIVTVASIMTKRALRRRRYLRMTEAGNDGAVVNLYLFFLDRFGRLGHRKIECPQGLSLTEFSRNYRPAFQAFEQHVSLDAAEFEDASDSLTDSVNHLESQEEREEGGFGASGFDVLTEAYGRVVYGGAQADERDRSLFDDYYANFYRNVRCYVGRLRYVLLFFRI